jgi:hypothetical protein
MNFKDKIVEVSRNNWGGMPYPDLKRELVECYTLLDFFFERTKNEYLGRTENGVLKSLEEDRPPKKFLMALLEEEKATKKRKNVIEFIEKTLGG